MKKKLDNKQMENVTGGEDNPFGDAEELNLTTKDKKELRQKAVKEFGAQK